ncbi:MAG: helix-turn-helix transcriptional regulator [Lachnospiraceae bacterium]|nr:helix-turn-helix transcriptional regulator [Lachnospiraceae bacterium]
MEINLKDKLRVLRQQKNITQEELAGYLGITHQSVGKWERGEGYPDITLLPKIALYFGVSVDELLGVDSARIEDKIDAYFEECRQYGFDGNMKKKLEVLEQAYQEFPNDCRVMSKLMGAILCECDEDPMPKDKVERIAALGEEILQKSTDQDLREGAIQVMCLAYKGVDDEKALQYANMAGDFIVNRYNLRCHVLMDEEGVKASQNYLMYLINEASKVAAGIPWKKRLSYEEMIEAYTFAIDIQLRLYSDGNTGFASNEIARNYLNLAHLYAELSDRENTLRVLEECCKYAIAFESTIGVDYDYTSLLVNRLRYDHKGTSKTYQGSYCNIPLWHMKKEKFDFVRDDERFRRVIAELKKYASEE